MANPIVQYILRLKDEASGSLKKTGEEAEETADKTKDAQLAFQKLGRAGIELAKVILGAGTAMMAFQQRMADVVNELVDLETRTGISRDTLNGLKLAAEGSGLSLSSIEASLLPLSKRMMEFTQGGGEARDAFERLGVVVTDSTGQLRSTDEVLKEVMSSMGDLENESERAALATQIFSRSGTRLLQALGDTRNLDAFIDRARTFGVDVGPAAARATGDWQRAMADLKLVSERAAQDLSKVFGDDGALGLLRDFTEGVVFLSNFTIPILKQGINEIKAMMEGLAILMEEGPSAAIQAWSDASIEGREFYRFEDLLDNALQKMREFQIGWNTLDSSVYGKAGGGTGDMMLGTLENTTAAVEDLKTELDGLRIGLSKVTEEWLLMDDAAPTDLVSRSAEIESSIQELSDSLKEPISQLEQFALLGIEIEAAYRQNLIPLEAYTQAMLDLGEATERAQRAQRMESFQNISGLALQGLGGDVGGALTGALSMMGPGGIVAGAGINLLSLLGQTGPEGESGVDLIVESIENFMDVIVAGIKALPEFIFSALPEIAFFILSELPLILVEAFVEGLQEWWSGAWDRIQNVFEPRKFGSKAEENGEERSGLGSGDGWFSRNRDSGFNGRMGPNGTRLALLHQNERLMGRSGGPADSPFSRGGVNVTINSTVVDQDAIPRLVRSMERTFGQYGRGTSPLFAGG